MTLIALTSGSAEEAQMIAVFLHGHGMSPQDFLPFANALGLPVAYHLLLGPCELKDGGHAWWPRDPWYAEQRGDPPWDLADERPPGLDAARVALGDYLRGLEAQRQGRPVIVVGFSQGGMLACDALLHEDIDIDGLALLSACRIASDDWPTRLSRLRGLPILVAHGTNDEVLALAAGESLRDAVSAGGADVQWLPFDGGHEIPLVVWRRLRGFMQELAKSHGET